MADLEAVLADVSYLMAMEKSKSTPAARASKKIILPEPSVMQKYLEERDELTFDKIFNQKIGFLLFKEFCLSEIEEGVPQLKFYEEIKDYEKLDSEEERQSRSRQIYDGYIMKELLSCSHPFSKKAVDHVQSHLAKKQVPPTLFQPYIVEICDSLRGIIFQKFIESDKFTRFCQWKNVELNIHCLDKKRIKMKQGETLALNERIMLSLVSTGDCPFIVCMTYAFHTPDKLCFILDLMNGGDLHYHLSQHGVFRTHGYMAPEVLQKGTAYDSSADWFSLGCMLFKLLRGHSPFRQHKTKDKHEIDRMTLTMVKEHQFFKGIDWQQVYLQKVILPSSNPSPGEVNAADAFDIGSFDEEDTKGIKLLDSDQELYKNFPLVISERWQQEVAETVYEAQNLLTMEQIVTVEETQIKDKKCILLRIKGGKQFVLQCESDPEFVQWKKELTEAFTEAQKLLRRAPKVIGKGRAGVVELSKPPLTHRNSNGL
ncbi:hypothetical protein F7725_015022 [Dissostichus mawsoni]|uniref:G protein-coupled receptor kinase n=1 Tax=Dissostichus mawsoni TaxID=36200 RepID=A0A7J5YGH0_DISMA|nr:hypothetical protein F7725_015022 [Dissostichus mawsoni]